MKTSNLGIQFIASYETSDGKPHLKAIKSPEQPNPKRVKYEIGFGHNSDDYFAVYSDTVITVDQAYDLLAHDVQEAEELVNGFIDKHHLRFKQQEFDAMVSAAYNGIPLYNENYGISRALIKFASPDFMDDCSQLVTKEWSKWVYMTKAGKKIRAKGLERRRADELEVFFNGDYRRN